MSDSPIKKTALLATLLVLAGVSSGQAQSAIPATTDDGRRVLLSPNGTWHFVGGEPTRTGTPVHGRPATATERSDLLRGKMAEYFDPSKWHATKSPELSRLTFQHTSGDGYAMIIAERLAIPLPQLKALALSNAKEAAPDARIVFEEPRTVNGLNVLAMQIAGTVQGIPFMYYGYYYSGPEGALQILTYTGQNLFSEYKADFEAFLNGIEATKP